MQKKEKKNLMLGTQVSNWNFDHTSTQSSYLLFKTALKKLNLYQFVFIYKVSLNRFGSIS